MKNTAVIILAAGKGKRLGSFFGNKVMAPLSGKPLIIYAVNVFEKLKVPIFVVVGYGKTKVKKIINDRAFFVEQKEQMGTAHAVSCVMPVISKDVDNIFVAMGDHAFALKPGTLQSLYRVHNGSAADVTLLTLKTKNYSGYGRIIRNEKDKIVKIIDSKHKKTVNVGKAEITPGLYLFNTGFLKEYIAKIQKDNISGEYYLSDIVELAFLNGKKISNLLVNDEKLAIGINTLDDYNNIKTIFKK